MIAKIEFIAKNLTSNAGVLLLLNYTNEPGIFQALDEILVFDNKSTKDIKMNHLKTLICGGFVGVFDNHPESFVRKYAQRVLLGKRIARVDDLMGALLFY